MNLGIEGKKALVTGASKGLGKSVALLLIDEGVDVIAISRSEIDYDATHIKCDLNKKIPDLKNYGIDIIVNNLGGDVSIRNPICTIDEWYRQFRFNLGINIMINNQLIPRMQKNKWGRIVNISSLSSTGSGKASDSYASIKSALNTYTVKLGKELAKYGIVVSAVMPSGFIYSGNGWDEFRKTRKCEYDNYINEKMPIRRLGTPEEIAPIVTFLCSQQASYCIGTIVPATGGR